MADRNPETRPPRPAAWRPLREIFGCMVLLVALGPSADGAGAVVPELVARLERDEPKWLSGD